MLKKQLGRRLQESFFFFPPLLFHSTFDGGTPAVQGDAFIPCLHTQCMLELNTRLIYAIWFHVNALLHVWKQGSRLWSYLSPFFVRYLYPGPYLTCPDGVKSPILNMYFLNSICVSRNTRDSLFLPCVICIYSELTFPIVYCVYINRERCICIYWFNITYIYWMPPQILHLQAETLAVRKLYYLIDHHVIQPAITGLKNISINHFLH